MRSQTEDLLLPRAVILLYQSECSPICNSLIALRGGGGGGGGGLKLLSCYIAKRPRAY